jgi:hypothetical protein
MTLKDLGEAVIWLGAIAGAMLAIAALLRWTVVKPLKHWLSEQVVAPAKDAADQIKPNGGPQDTTRHLIEQISDHAAELVKRVDELGATAVENRDIANAALTLAKSSSERLDMHLNSHGSSRQQ